LLYRRTGFPVVGVKDRVEPATRIGFKTSHFEEPTVCRRDFSRSMTLRFREVRHGKPTQDGCGACDALLHRVHDQVGGRPRRQDADAREGRTSYPLPSNNSTRYEPYWPVMPVINALLVMTATASPWSRAEPSSSCFANRLASEDREEGFSISPTYDSPSFEHLLRSCHHQTA